MSNEIIDLSPRHKYVPDFAETCLIMDTFTWVREYDLLIRSQTLYYKTDLFPLSPFVTKFAYYRLLMATIANGLPREK